MFFRILDWGLGVWLFDYGLVVIIKCIFIIGIIIVGVNVKSIIIGLD